ncbi:MAG: hypothetical protein JXQ80_12170 [Bacteroidales bacterium]|nr:hypothetical protein [Bacteroidales bacterium]
MRQIKISEINLPGKTNYIKFNMYSVFLGNESRNYFSNRKDAKQFLANTNRFLNIKLHEFNHVYTGVLSEYQRNWFYFDSQNGHANKQLSKSETTITDNFHSITKAMMTIVTRSSNPNGNYFTFTSFFHCIRYCNEIIEILILLLKDRKHYIEIKSLEILKGHLNTIHQELNAYGKEKAPVEITSDMEFID